MLGVPSDSLITESPGASEGPDAIRQASQHTGSYSVSDQKLSDRRNSRLADIGNVQTNRADPEETLSFTYHTVCSILEIGAAPVVVGGDHSLTYGCVKAAAEHYPDVCLLHIDAHYDATDPSEYGCRINHGTYVRNLIQDNIIGGSQIIQIGMRDYQWSASAYNFISSNAVWTLPIREFENEGAKPFFNKLNELKNIPLYISLDIDSVEPAFAPGAGEDMPGGFYSREILAIIKRIFAGQHKIIGCDLVEVNPLRDSRGITCSLAAELLGLMVDGLTKPTAF